MNYLEKNIEYTNMEQMILELTKKKLTYKQIKLALGIKSEEEIKKLDEALNNLVARGDIYINNFNEYQNIATCNNLWCTTIKYNKKHAYVIIKDTSHIIEQNHLNGAIDGDNVIIKLYEKQGKTYYVVEKILKRNSKGIIFDYIDGKLLPQKWPYPIDVHVDKATLKKIVNGNRIMVKISLEKTDNKYNGQIVSIVGHKDDPDTEIKTIACNNGIVIDFSKEALEQANSINTTVTKCEIEKRCNNGGLDLRNETIFTIDGEKTKDIDDAVSIKKLENGNYQLGVHIADVSYYVEENSILDLEARERSTSVYPYNCVIPMLPHILSNGICSLNPNVDRLAFSCIMEIDANGEIINYEHIDTIINSKKKMTYEKINDIFERHMIDPEYTPYLKDLALMMELSEILSKRKFERGYISFDDEDITFEDENGITVNIKKRTRGMAEKMIENFMLAANEATSSYYYWLDMPGIYRDHPAPNSDSVKEIIDLLGLNISIPKNLENPRIMQNIIMKLKKYDQGGVYSDFLLRAMKRAYYSTTNIGHFGLALNYYTHFTSPIRRYPDLATHRVLRKLRSMSEIDVKELNSVLKEICANSSSKEKIADKVEREANHYKMAEFMEQHIGETFVSYIHHISKNSITIKTDNLIFGKIPMDKLIEDGFVFNEENMSLRNNENDITLFIGDRIEALLINAQKETGKIEFELNKKLEKSKKRKLAQN